MFIQLLTPSDYGKIYKAKPCPLGFLIYKGEFPILIDNDSAKILGSTAEEAEATLTQERIKLGKLIKDCDLVVLCRTGAIYTNYCLVNSRNRDQLKTIEFFNPKGKYNAEFVRKFSREEGIATATLYIKKQKRFLDVHGTEHRKIDVDSDIDWLLCLCKFKTLKGE